MNSMETMAVVSLPVTVPVVRPTLSEAKVPATTLTKEATTRISTSRAKIRKSLWALGPMESRMTSPMDLPSCRMEANREPKSCNPPKKMPPTTHQRNTGTQPKTAAWMGPLMGPAPAMEEKWCPIRTAGFAAT